MPTIHSGSFELAQACMVQIQETLAKYGGMLRQFLTDDKGTVASE